ncbi:MAG: riboflavin synthase [Alphaproteobacteria bacterium]|jgi:riboflavin synthase|nr:riboflavin synthase [Alphaproteobacteria bacterium]
MFTGIIKNIGIIKELKKRDNGYFLSVTSGLNFNKKDIGTSISCSGVCLTLTKIKKNNKKNELFFYLSKHTILTSAFKYLKSGDMINLEKSMKYGDEFAGHFVQGHVDTTIKVLNINSNNIKSWTIFFNIPKKFVKFLIEKGSIAINGVSLTIAKIFSNKFKVVIIPHTLQNTNLLKLKKNNYVNVEIDLIAKTLLKK